MPLRNRVTPYGEIIATSARGTMMGNRGVLHDGQRQLGRARWKHNNWVACVLSFHGRRREIMTPGRYTELFFLDEAVAFAAGHRPCGECRRASYRVYMALWASQCADLGPAHPKAVDRALHGARIDQGSRGQRRYDAPLDGLPDGTFIDLNGSACLIHGPHLIPYAPTGYGSGISRPQGVTVTVLTPEPTVRILAAGYHADVALG